MSTSIAVATVAALLTYSVGRAIAEAMAKAASTLTGVAILPLVRVPRLLEETTDGLFRRNLR
jgi:hypothetical protein